MGKTRDLDGSVDRIPPPPDSMWPLLYAIQLKCQDENINLEGVMEEGGGTHYGMMKRTQFESTLKTNLPRYHITEETYAAIRNHYGCGYKVRVTPALMPRVGRARPLVPVCACARVAADQPCAADADVGPDPARLSHRIPGASARTWRGRTSARMCTTLSTPRAARRRSLRARAAARST